MATPTQGRWRAAHVGYCPGGPRVKSTGGRAGAGEARGRCDFDALRAHPEARSGYRWAADTHGDWVEWSTLLLEPTRPPMRP